MGPTSCSGWGDAACEVASRNDPRRGVGDADVEDPPSADLVVERSHRLIDRRVPVPHVYPVDVNVVGAKSP
jgi:hypothetical protein